MKTAKQKIQVGDFVRLISPEDFLRGEEGQVKKSTGGGRWEIRLDSVATVYRHETELLVVASGSTICGKTTGTGGKCILTEGHEDFCEDGSPV